MGTRLKMLLVGTLVMLAVGGAAATSASARVNWKDNGTFLTPKQLTLVLSKTSKVLFHFQGITLLCNHRIDADVFGLGKTHVLSYTLEGCHVTVPVSCTVLSAAAGGLPWQGTLRGLKGKLFDLIKNTKLTFELGGAECSKPGSFEVTGNLEGEWNNAKSELIFPETPLEGSTLKSGGEEAKASSNDETELEGGATLTVGSEEAGGQEECGNIVGAGSSLQNIAQKNVWIEGPEAFDETGEEWVNSGCSSEPTIAYFPTSSGKGLAQWGNNAGKELKDETGVSPFPAYIGTDVGPEGSEATGEIGNLDTAGKSGGGTKNGVLTVPVAQSAIAVIVSLPVGCTATGTPKVKSLSLEKEWHEHNVTLGNLVKGVTCGETPQLDARFSASGTTAGFKRWLDGINSTNWGTFTSTAAKSESPSEWPIAPTEEEGGEKFEKGSQLADAVLNKPGTTGAIGYADLADAIKAEFTQTPTLHTTGGKTYLSFFVEVQRNGKNETEAKTKYASPEGAEGSSNCGESTYTTPPEEVKINADWSGAKQNNVQSTNTYPICTLTFDVAWHKYSFPEKGGSKVYGTTSEARNTVLNYLHYIVKNGQNAALNKAHYGQLTGALLAEAQAGVTNPNIEF